MQNLNINKTFIKKIDEQKHVTFLESFILKKGEGTKNKAIFFDRDGVLIKDVHYIKDPRKVLLLNGVIKLLKSSKDLGFLNIIITNQSGIKRNLFNWEDYEKVTKRMIELINIPNCFNAIYACGELPSTQTSRNSWRKPNPNMILRAAKDFKIDLSKSILIGDRYSDIISGEKAGIGNLIHVLTGHGSNERKKILDNFDNQLDNLHLVKDLNSISIEKIILKTT